MKLWIRKILLLPLLPIISTIMLLGLLFIVAGEYSRNKINVTIERPEKVTCKTIRIGNYVCCRNCDFKEFA